MGRWGSGLFEGDQDLDYVCDLEVECGLYQLQKEAVAQAEAEGNKDAEMEIYYSMVGGGSHPEIVRNYLDSGPLDELIKSHEEKMLADLPPGRYNFSPSYFCVLIAACAMTLGCRLPASFLSLLRKVHPEAELLPGGFLQMQKALFGPDPYQNGVPYDFASKNLLETANSDRTEDQDPDLPSPGMNVYSISTPNGPFYPGLIYFGEEGMVQELRDKRNRPDECGACGATSGYRGRALLTCATCNDRKYCTRRCQKKYWKIHKKICVEVFG